MCQKIECSTDMSAGGLALNKNNESYNYWDRATYEGRQTLKKISDFFRGQGHIFPWNSLPTAGWRGLEKNISPFQVKFILRYILLLVEGECRYMD